MWLIYQSLFGFEAGSVTAYVITMSVIGVVGIQFVDRTRTFTWFVQQIPGAVLWTDVINMVVLGMFDEQPLYWWAYGWTISMVPYVGHPGTTVVIWCGVWLLYGPSLYSVGFIP